MSVGKNKKEDVNGFSGLSTLISDVDETMSSSEPLPKLTKSSVSPSDPYSSQGQFQETISTSSGDDVSDVAAGKWMVGIGLGIGLMLIVLINSTKTETVRSETSTAAVPIPTLSDGYIRLNVKGRVQIDLPENWTINDVEHRQRVKELAGNLTGLDSQHLASLSVRSNPAPSRVFVRVSFFPMDPPLTQTDIRHEVRANKKQVLNGLAEVWREESGVMWAELAKFGMKEVGNPSFDVETIGGQTALIISYGRTSSANPTDTMRVTQYHVPLGVEKALITLSYIQGDQRAIAAHSRLKNSLVIR